nr:glycosyltransferase family 1 protein [Methanomicrobium sp. W14]
MPKKIIDYLWHFEFLRKNIIGNVDILHSTTFCTPRDHYGKLIVTIYDVSFQALPECHTEENRQHCLKGTIDAVNNADCIITISNHGKNELVKYFDADPDKIKVTYLAAKDIFSPSCQDEQKKIIDKYKLSKGFILFVGSYEPRKNLITLVKAYVSLPESTKKRHLLVIAGGKGWLNSEIDDIIELNKSSDIRRIGYVDEDDLPGLYSAADVFVYPSLYEGFGLPILEAMACGAPVITSNTSSMTEVGGNAALYFDPHDENQLRELLIKTVDDESLKEDLRQNGFRNAKKFSWEKTARKTLQIYESVYKND